jgi:hypothetical protein
MELNLNHTIRSAVALVVGLPVTLAIALGAMPEGNSQSRAERLKEDLELPCLQFAFTQADTKGEREAKDLIDERFGSNANYGAVCKWVLG